MSYEDPLLSWVDTRVEKTCSVEGCKKTALMEKYELFCPKCRKSGKADEPRIHSISDDARSA